LSVLSELNVGESGVLVGLDLPESVQNHLMHMGFVPDALITALRRAPAGDPTVYGVDGMEIALRRETAAAIRVRAPETDQEAAEEEDGMEFMDSQVPKSGPGAPSVHEIPERIEAAQ
jgi:ferrous iron transport protein A